MIIIITIISTIRLQNAKLLLFKASRHSQAEQLDPGQLARAPQLQEVEHLEPARLHQVLERPVGLVEHQVCPGARAERVLAAREGAAVHKHAQAGPGGGLAAVAVLEREGGGGAFFRGHSGNLKLMHRPAGRFKISKKIQGGRLKTRGVSAFWGASKLYIGIQYFKT